MVNQDLNPLKKSTQIISIRGRGRIVSSWILGFDFIVVPHHVNLSAEWQLWIQALVSTATYQLASSTDVPRSPLKILQEYSNFFCLTSNCNIKFEYPNIENNRISNIKFKFFFIFKNPYLRITYRPWDVLLISL